MSSLEEFKRFQLPALRRDAERLEKCRAGKLDKEEIRTIAARVLRVVETILAEEWLPPAYLVEEGFDTLGNALARERVRRLRARCDRRQALRRSLSAEYPTFG